MNRTGQCGMKGALVVIMAAVALGMMPTISGAKAGETAHLRLGIVCADEVPRAGVGRGVRVIEVLGPRFGPRLERGDLLLRLDGRRVHDGAELADALDELGDGSISVEVLRRGELRELRLRRNLNRFVVRDVVGRVHRDVLRDVIQDVRRDVIRDVRRNRHRVVWALRDDRAQVRDALRQVRQQLRELEARLEAEGWR